MPISALKDFLETASARVEQDAAVDAILDAVREHLGMEIAFAARWMGTRRQFTHIRAAFPVPSAPGDCEPREDGFCHHIQAGRLPELIRDSADHPLAATLPITAALPVGAHISVPLTLKDGSIYGSFCCLSRTPDYTLTERDLDTVKAFANLAAVQIEKDIDARRGRDSALARIGGAIESGQPAILLQPIHRLTTGAPAGVEALARFHDAGDRPPSDWFNEAAALGVGLELEMAAVRAAVATLPYVPAPLYLAVNVAPTTVLSGALDAVLSAAPAGRIVVEVTEHAEVESYRELRSALAGLRGHVRVAVDDVGAGYAGLRHILDLEPDILKLDMGLTRDVHLDPARRALIGAMVDFASEIGASIVAEGIESVGERDAVAALGVHCAQGWHYSRPMPPVAALHYLSADRAEPAPAPTQSRRKAA